MGGSTNELSGPDLEQGVAFAALEDGKPVLGHAHGEAVVLVRVGADVHAIGATCSHYGGPLAEGRVEGDVVVCPWHHACFDLRTGEAVGAPALRDLPCFEVARRGELVQVRARKETPRRTAPNAPSSVVLVGAGAAAAACIEMLRKEGYSGPITMLGDEEPVDRPNLSKDYLAGTAPEEWMPLGGRERWVELGVDYRPNDPAVAIDTKSRTVTTKGGDVLPYGALLYAPGAEPVRLAIPGGDLPHVSTLRTLTDARAIIERAKTAKRAVVVGASFIGLEAAASLVARGLEVHVVAPDHVPLGRILGEEVGAFLRKVHEDKGVRFHLGTKPKAIREGAVELENGETLAAELVVVGIGVRPRTSLAQAAGLVVENGVVVDTSLRTSADAVWAAGDVARFPDTRTGERVRIEHWVVAERHGQAAARAILGRAADARDVPFFWSAHHDVTISYVGHASKWDRVTVHGSLEARDATIVYESAGVVMAVATINRDAVSLAVEAAMRRGDAAAAAQAAHGSG